MRFFARSSSSCGSYPRFSTMQVIDAPDLEKVVRDNAVLYLLLHDGSDPRIVVSVSWPCRISTLPNH